MRLVIRSGIWEAVFFVLVNTYLMIYITDILSINNAIVGTLIFITNIWNALVDVLWDDFCIQENYPT